MMELLLLICARGGALSALARRPVEAEVLSNLESRHRTGTAGPRLDEEFC